MNYKLAKKLFDAGFPQRDWGDVYSCEEGHELMMIPQRLRAIPAGINVGETISCPTLSELIGMCGNDFGSLEKTDSAPMWHAVKYPLNKVGHGETPEEAVANLWLELNKKP